MRRADVSADPGSGRLSIIAVQDTRKILTADPRDAVLSLKQVSIKLPEGHDRASRPSRSSPASRRPRATSAAAAAPTRSPPISTAKSSSQRPGQDARPAARAAGNDAADAGRPGDPPVRLARGGRARAGDVRPRRVDPTAPSFDQVYNQLNEERVNTRSRRYLRDLRRDAVIDFR
jgi:peptidyl-prolyl cis-trans isomerase SurA